MLARLIQKEIFRATGLTCSLGVAPNKLIAKMASEFEKPNGISVLHEQDVQARIWPLPVRKINGIGLVGSELHRLHLHTIGDIAAQPRDWLIDNFGQAYGGWMHDAAWGRDDRPVVTESEPVSMSRETTFERDLHAVRDREALGAIFTDLCTRVAEDLQRKGYVGRTIASSCGTTISAPPRGTRRWSNSPRMRRPSAARRAVCLKRVDLGPRLRLLGVRVGKLSRADALPAGPVAPQPAPPIAAEHTPDLFHDAQAARDAG